MSAGDTLLVRAGDVCRSGHRERPVGHVVEQQGTDRRVSRRDGLAEADSEQRHLSDRDRSAYIEFDGINIDGTNAVPWHRSIGSRFETHPSAECGTSSAVRRRAGARPFAAATIVSLFDLPSTVAGRLRGPAADQCSSFGFYSGGDNNLIDSCEIYDTGGAGIQIYHGVSDAVGQAANNIIRNNRIHDIRRSGDAPGRLLWGIIIGNGSNNQVYNNLIYNMGISGGAGQMRDLRLQRSGTTI